MKLIWETWVDVLTLLQKTCGRLASRVVRGYSHRLRLLFARLGTQYCPHCRVAVDAQTRDEVGRPLRAELRRREGLLLLAPVIKNRKGFHTDVAACPGRHTGEALRQAR